MSETAEKVDGRLERGRRTREAVLDAAVSLASVDGLEGLSLANLAANLGVGKSTLFAHWPTKEDLQLAVIEQALQQWRSDVIGPALAVPRGVRRLVALHDSRLDFYRRSVLPGRCFFFTAQAEFDDRPGRVHERLLEIYQLWLGFIASVVEDAVKARELAPDTDPRQIAFMVESLGDGVVPAARLADTETVFRFAHEGLLAVINAAGGAKALKKL